MNKFEDQKFLEFKTWYDNFIARNGGLSPPNLQFWYRQNERTHERLRGFLGQWKIDLPIQIDNGQNPASLTDIEPIYQELKTYLPQLFQAESGVTKESLVLPLIKDGTHNGIRTNKLITKYIDTYGEFNKTKLHKVISQLGQLWSKNRSTAMQCNVCMSTTPVAFVLLGHYGPDSDSCFRQGSTGTADKYILGQSTNTFVLTISSIVNNKEKNIARIIGTACNNNTVFSLFNSYYAHGANEGDVVAIVEKFFTTLLKSKVTVIDGSIGPDPMRSVQINPFGKLFVIQAGSNVTDDAYQIYADPIGFKRHFCQKCAREYDYTDSAWKEADGILCCPRCVAIANTCDITGKISFEPLVTVVTQDGSVLACQEVSRQLKTCNNCKSKHTSDGEICHQCKDEIFNSCDECGETFHEHELNYTEYGDVCNKCLKCEIRQFSPEQENEISNA